MNKEYRYLDGKVIVKDENDQERIVEYSNKLNEILVQENKIEIVNNKLEALNEELKQNKGVIILSNLMLKSLPILLLLTSLGAGIYGWVTSPSDQLIIALYNGISTLLYGSIGYGVSAIYYSIVKRIYIKQVDKTETEIKITEKLKEYYEKQLTNLKETQLTIDNPKISMNEPISLVTTTNNIENTIDETVDRIYNNSLNQNSKKLTRKKTRR